MKLAELARRLTGISTPVIGVSWEPPVSESDAARRVLVFLEDRRVLYEPSELEVPEQCVESSYGFASTSPMSLETSKLIRP